MGKYSVNGILPLSSNDPNCTKHLNQLREGNVLVVWKLDRLSRSLKDLLHIMERAFRPGWHVGQVSAEPALTLLHLWVS